MTGSLTSTTSSVNHQAPRFRSKLSTVFLRVRKNPITFLPKKYKPLGSVALFDGDNDRILTPGASTSSGAINSGDDLVTPAYPGQTSRWPSHGVPLIVCFDSDFFNQDPDVYPRSEADVYAPRSLTRNNKPVHKKGDGSKRTPDTPVKKLKATRSAVERPLQSAFARKIGSEEFGRLLAEVEERGLPPENTSSIVDE